MSNNSEMLSRRRFPRRRFQGWVGLLFDGHYTLVKGLEIGEGGIRIETDQPLLNLSQVVVNYFVPNKGFVTVSGEVVNVVALHESDFKMVGVRFINLSFEAKRLIRDYIAAKTKRETEVTDEIAA